MDKIQYGYGLPPDFSAHGHGIDQLIILLHIFMVVLFVGWAVFLTFTLIKFRARSGHKANYESVKSKLPKYIEVAVVGFEVFLLIGLSFPIWNQWKTAMPNEKEALTVRIVAQQFLWNTHYAGEDKKFGRTDVKLISDYNPLGIDKNDPASGDDFYTSGPMHFPVNRPVIAQITSKDVIHSFGVPVLRLKQDATPGVVIPIWFTATKEGEFDVHCSQLCGVGHSRMKGIIKIQSAEAFEKWQQEQKRPYKKKTKAAQKPQAEAVKG